MRLVQVVLEIRNVCRAVVPVYWHEIDAASERGARAEEVSEPGEATRAVGDSWCAERGTVGEWHHVLHVCVRGVLGTEAGLDSALAPVWLVEGHQVSGTTGESGIGVVGPLCGLLAFSLCES